ncbi:Gp37-like protein [Marininema halotolerans]|uniref:Virus ReqiPepy6 Gp37-like protein n=1 Tax=Marininema halotolerans TaxID=1155944 RepID=A0A1I6URI6_9BACL|nr:hypothetical protein [Marininema halotolerans]SFT04046.1 virus ReqiPepy6 Gp37-like protein [Marininema halotolerans]
MAEYRVRVRDKTFGFIGEIDEWISLEISLMYNDISKWILKLDANSKGAQFFYDLMMDSNIGGVPGIHVERNGYFLLSGPMTDAEEVVSPSEGETLTIYGSCDMQWIADRLALPHPKYMASPYMTSSLYGDGSNGHQDAYPNAGDTKDRYASNHIHAFVSDNIGQDQEYPLRRLPFLNCISRNCGYLIPNEETSYGRGENLLQLIQGIADYSEYKGKPLQILCRQYWTGSKWEVRFETVEPSSKPGAVMSQSLGSIIGYTYKRSRPTANMIQVGGSGEGVKRVFAHSGDNPSIAYYGLIESFEEYTGTKYDEKDPKHAKELKVLVKEVKAKLKETAEQTVIQLNFQETQAVQYGRDFGLGDKVPIYLKRTSTTDIVRSATFRLQGKEETIELTIGNQGVISKGLRVFDRLNKLEYRYNGLTKRTLGE